MKKFMSHLSVYDFSFLFVGSVVVMSNQAWSQTPDGETPADEDVCDGLTGAAWGLCNAYCEAMDCDGVPQASDAACNRVADNFDKNHWKYAVM